MKDSPRLGWTPLEAHTERESDLLYGSDSRGRSSHSDAA
jgi:hypothetical protein